MTSSPRTLRSRPATCVALTIVAASTAACELPSQGAKFANQYVSMQPTGSPPILTGYQFELGKKVSADACAEPNTHYQVALVGVNGSPSLGELAAAREAMTMLGDADMLLVIHSRGARVNGKACGEITGRAIKLRAIDLPVDTVRQSLDTVRQSAEHPTTEAPKTPKAPKAP